MEKFYFVFVASFQPCMGTIVLELYLLMLQKRNFVDWANSDFQMNKELKLFVGGRMENDAADCLQVDFANKYLGGGSVYDSCTQEEILFVLYPELIASILFTVELDKNESLVVTGCERFNDSEGYLNSFRWTGNHVDESQRDAWGRRSCEIVAIDAMVISTSLLSNFSV